MLVGNIVRRNLKAQITRFAQFHNFGKGQIQVICSHRADAIKIWRRVSGSPKISRGYEAVGIKPVVRSVRGTMRWITRQIGPLV